MIIIVFSAIPSRYHIALSTAFIVCKTTVLPKVFVTSCASFLNWKTRNVSAPSMCFPFLLPVNGSVLSLNVVNLVMADAVSIP